MLPKYDNEGISGTTGLNGLTLPMLRLLLSKAQECKDFWKSSKLSHVGIHWIALAEYSQMSTRVSVSAIF